DVDFNEYGRISPGLAMSIANEFQRQDVHISVLGCYLHFFHQDEAIRRNNVNRFKELIRYASLFGAPMVAAETGSNSVPFTKQDWAIMKNTLEELVEEAEKWGVFVGLEAAHGHLIGTAPELAQMLDEVPSSLIGVVIDPGNLLHEGNLEQQDTVMNEAFSLLGNHIIGAHAKDRIRVADGTVQTVPAGQGSMNYELYMKLLNQYKPEAHIIMETATEEQMADCKAFIEEIRARV
ncbi:MAG TPA: sugar phosphate isomerase/epimerase, partial [Candidatus Paenibacillus intestinavium]|nr:sugar phosphate isomerase/epimerase [Candidatus Paenibacillus intestinavium]